jgi:hypothetical protein
MTWLLPSSSLFEHRPSSTRGELLSLPFFFRIVLRQSRASTCGLRWRAMSKHYCGNVKRDFTEEDQICGPARRTRHVRHGLHDLYKSFGDDPFVVPADPKAAPVTFSAWDYARERCAVIEGG